MSIDASTHYYPDSEEVAVYMDAEDGSSTKDIHIMFPQLFGKRRNGEHFVRKLPVKQRVHDANVVKSFEAQDKLKNDYRSDEINGHDSRFSILFPDGSLLTFSKFMSDWFLTNSLIATIYRSGWNINVC